jgi:predicted nucleic acid-binding Zn ribbon protein
MCGKPISMGETLCSDECKNKYQSMSKRRRFLLYLMYAMLAILVAVFLITMRA